jgi:hypothetical protein
MKRSNSQDRSRRIGLARGGGVRCSGGIADLAARRATPRKGSEWDTLDARSFIVDACVAHQTRGIEKRLHECPTHRASATVEIARETPCRAMATKGPRKVTTMGPLAGFRIIEMAGIGPAPFAATLLADMGPR